MAMLERPLSDRRHHEPTGVCWEVRAWSEPPGNVPDVQGWRSVAWSAEHDDAVLVARSLVTGPEHPYEFVEVWGPGSEVGGRSHQCERFPEPSSDEKREMWLRAAAAHFTDGMDLPHRTTI